MRAFGALLAKELRGYYGGPLVYLVGAAFLAYTGHYFHSDLIYFVTFGFGLNIMENFWQLVFIDMRLVIILSVPLLTMRSLAEERRLGTLELLLSYPVSDRAVVGAKFAAFTIVMASLVGGTLTYPYLVYAIQPFDWSPLVAAYLGLFLLAVVAGSFGIFVSACTESQVLAGFFTVVPLFLLWLVSWNEAAVGPEQLPALQLVSLFSHYQPFTVGIIDARDVFYFAFLIGVFFWATLEVLAARHWRGR